MSDKYASDLPLPGGVEQYYETLVALLQRVAADLFDYAQLQDLVREVCPNAKKSTAIGQYISLIRMMGYWSQDERGIYRITSEGSQLLELEASDPLKAKRFVLLNKVRDFAGYDVVLAFLALGPADFNAVQTHLKAALNVTWQSPNQTSFRVNWLRSLGYVLKNGGELCLTAVGKDIVGSIGLPPKKLTPNDKHKETTSSLSARAQSIITCEFAGIPP